MADHISKVPYDVLRTIGKCLDYDARANFNRVIPFEGRFVKKMKDQDAHNLCVKTQLMNSKMNTIINKSNTYDRAVLVVKLFQYLVDTKDTVLFELTTLTYRGALIDKVHEFSEDDVYYRVDADEATRNRIKSNMRAVGSCLLQKINDIPFRKHTNVSLVQVS